MLPNNIFKRVKSSEDTESYSLMEQDIPDIQQGVQEMIDAIPKGMNQRLIHEVLKLKGLSELDTCSSSCVETFLPVAYNSNEMYEYVCEFAISISNWSTDITGFNPYWRFDLSIEGFNIPNGTDVIIQQIDFTCSKNTNDPNNIGCIGSYYRKPTVKDLPLQITAIESTAQNKPNSYIGDCYLTVKFLASSRLI